MTTKKCSKCKEELSIENFSPIKKKPNKWYSACLPCERKRQAPKLCIIDDLIEKDEHGNIHYERWVDVIGYERIYQISDFGRFKRIMHKHNPANNLIKPSEISGGYLAVGLSKNAKSTTFLVSRLVAIHFIPNPDNLPEVNHIGKYENGVEGNKKDNRFFSLCWSTSSDNIRHAFDNGLRKPTSGESHGNSKLTEEKVLEIRAIKGMTYVEISKLYDVNPECISKVVRRISWTHI